jgi:hypothetical protein
LTDAIIKDAILEKADFRTSFGFSIDPAINKIKRAKFGLSGLPGLLDSYDLDIDINS